MTDALEGRITLAPTDTSHADSDQVTTAEYPLAALANSKHALGAAGLPLEYWRNVGSSYNELQVWGELPITRQTIKKIRIPYSDRFIPEEKFPALIQLAMEQGIPIEGHEINTGENKVLYHGR